jgi:hypothetical protein
MAFSQTSRRGKKPSSIFLMKTLMSASSVSSFSSLSGALGLMRGSSVAVSVCASCPKTPCRAVALREHKVQL